MLKSSHSSEGVERRLYRSYILTMCLMIGVLLSGLFLGMAIRTRSIIFDELVSYGRAYFETIIATRTWNANYGGVYVFKSPGVVSNPYLKDPDIKTADGRVLTLRNPAMMTREISEIVRKGRDFSFHITSHKLMNPDNNPDAFESEALAKFESGLTEFHRIEDISGRKFFRYMAPLYIAEPCLKCHSNFGYKVGDVRGGISVTFSVDDMYVKLRQNTFAIMALSVTTCVLLILTFWVQSRKLMSRLTEARQQIEEMAVTDDLTKVHNRRHLTEQLGVEHERAKRLKLPLSVLITDIDHFKRINDTQGHLAGDVVLKEVAGLIKRSARKYDIVGRFGGEEFMVIMPGARLDEAEALANRIRELVKPKGITVSTGVATLSDKHASADSLVRDADDLLYRAKASGRDCVATPKSQA